jgi:hypothetical protein
MRALKINIDYNFYLHYHSLSSKTPINQTQ